MPTLSSTMATAPPMQAITAKQYSLSLLSEYAHTLDALPLDLSRIFADLRELDAVLTSTVSTITAKILRLIEMIENKETVTNESRLWLLGEIAEDAAKVRPGAEDKIRIATQAADALQTQASHLTMILRHLPDYDTTAQMRRTVYPHVSSKPYTVPPFESGRRRRVATGGGLLLGSGDGSPNKRRRIVQEEDMEYGTAKTPRRDKPADSTSGTRGPRGGGRVKKVERLPSPSESLLSIASPMPGPSSAAGGLQRNNTANGHRHNGNNNSANNNTGSSSKRRGGANNAQAHHNENTSLLDSVLSRKEHQSLPPSSSTAHPSLMDQDRSGANHDADRKGSHSHNHAGGKGGSAHQDWSSSNGQHQADGHGAVANAARASTSSTLTNVAPTNVGSPAPALAAASPTTAADDAGDGDAEDGQTYCICNGISYGEMIACDDGTCEREWFHLACMGLTTPPEGKWYCDDCTVKRANRRPSRGGKKKGGGGRVGGRSGANGN